MSFLEQLKSKKNVLKNTTTIITQIDGKSYVENSSMRQLGMNAEEIKDVPKTYGFVVDNSPDKIPSEVIPGLFIGSQDCVEADILKSFSISSVVSVEIFPEISDIDRLCVSCLDLPEENIMPVLEKSNLFIKGVLERKKSVLVHCNAGVSRAAMVVIGFLIMENNFDFQKAYNLVKSKRPCIQPNSGFVKQLKSIADKL